MQQSVNLEICSSSSVVPHHLSQFECLKVIDGNHHRSYHITTHLINFLLPTPHHVVEVCVGTHRNEITIDRHMAHYTYILVQKHKDIRQTHNFHHIRILLQNTIAVVYIKQNIIQACRSSDHIAIITVISILAVTDYSY